MKRTMPNSSTSPHAARRAFLRYGSGLCLGVLARPLFSAAPDAVADVCSAGHEHPALFLPGDRGYLGRLAPRGKAVTLVATRAGALPSGIVHGTLAYRARFGGREYVNPLLVVRRGERVRMRLVNRLDQPTITHWHGLSVDTRNDGGGMTLIAPNETYDYEFDARDRSSLYWYHPHPHGQTGGQLYGGLYGVFEIEDDEQASLRDALDLVPGRSEVVLVLRDRRRDAAYAPSPADLVHGFLGDACFVNGAQCPRMDVASRVYRLRILNACNARTLCLAFRTAAGARLPFTIIGNDGGLLPAPQRAEQAFVAAAERLDILVDLRDAPVGETIVLESVAFDPMHAEVAATPEVDHAAMGHASEPAAPASSHAEHQHASTWSEGAARALLHLRVRRRVAYDRVVPATLSAVEPIDVAGARERPLRLGFNKGRWRINDRVFVMGETPIEVARDTTEVWLLRNYHTSMPHAMHLHGFHFEVLERETSPEFVHALAIDDRGRLPTDLGRKDTVLVWPGESVRAAIRFAMPFDAPQTYVFHCHNVEHEDGGMMLGVKVA